MLNTEESRAIVDATLDLLTSEKARTEKFLRECQATARRTCLVEDIAVAKRIEERHERYTDHVGKLKKIRSRLV